VNRIVRGRLATINQKGASDMRKTKLPLIILGAALVPLLQAAPTLAAGATRTFVSATGSDSNPCSFGQPCRSLVVAYAATVAGGEIVALDAAGYGSLTITGPISIVGAEPISVTVPNSTTGITVSAGASDIIILKNFHINGGGTANANTGIQLTSGRLVLQNSTLKLLGTGLALVSSTKSDVMSTDIIGNNVGILTSGTGSVSSVFPPAGPTQVRIYGGSLVDNTTAVVMNDPGHDQFNNINSTVLLSTPVTTNIVGNPTFVSCTVETCTGVLTYGSSAQGSSNTH
jgi:hypothetical protein